MIHTLDFFTPIVDDPYQYGAIAAANAVSDIYAMGGEVLLALNIYVFPAAMDADVIGQILRGGASKVAEAGGVLAGGHTTDDKEPKYGLSVLGIVHPDCIWTKAGARARRRVGADQAAGAGIIATAFKGGVADPDHVAAMTASMAALNPARCNWASTLASGQPPTSPASACWGMPAKWRTWARSACAST